MESNLYEQVTDDMRLVFGRKADEQIKEIDRENFQLRNFKIIKLADSELHIQRLILQKQKS